MHKFVCLCDKMQRQQEQEKSKDKQKLTWRIGDEEEAEEEVEAEPRIIRCLSKCECQRTMAKNAKSTIATKADSS